MNWARSRVAAHQLEEAVDVDVVERRLDLVEDVERARPREEDREHEGQRDQRLLAARQQRQALRGLARRGDLDLHAAISGCSSSSGSSSGCARLVASGALAADHRARRLLGAAPAAAAPRPPGNRCCDHLLEVPRGGLEGLLEALADAPVGLLDQALELGQRAPPGRARCASSSSTWATASSYSCLASGLTGPSCSRRRARRSTRASRAVALLLGQGARLRGSARAPACRRARSARARASAAVSRTCWARDLGCR